jgi:hypothetical protein
MLEGANLSKVLPPCLHFMVKTMKNEHTNGRDRAACSEKQHTNRDISTAQRSFHLPISGLIQRQTIVDGTP